MNYSKRDWLRPLHCIQPLLVQLFTNSHQGFPIFLSLSPALSLSPSLSASFLTLFLFLFHLPIYIYILLSSFLAYMITIHSYVHSLFLSFFLSPSNKDYSSLSVYFPHLFNCQFSFPT